MKPSIFNGFLRNAAGEGGEGGGGAATAPAVAAPGATQGDSGEESEGEEEEDPEKKEEEPQGKVSQLLLSARAAFQDKGALLKRATDAEAKVTAVQTEHANTKGELARVSAELDALKAERAELEQLLSGAKAETEEEKKKNKTVEEAAVEKVAALGMKAGDVPAAEVEEETVEALTAKLNAESDPVKKFRIAAKINALEFGTN